MVLPVHGSSGSADKSIRLWDIDTGECHRMMETPFPGWQVDCLRVFADGELYSGTGDGLLRSATALSLSTVPLLVMV